jgi:flagellar biogenesis protein FliO
MEMLVKVNKDILVMGVEQDGVKTLTALRLLEDNVIKQTQESLIYLCSLSQAFPSFGLSVHL